MNWSWQFRQAVVEQLFTEDDGAVLHDVIVEAIDKSYNEEQIRTFVLNLPEELLCIALQWGMSDTQFRYDVFTCLKRKKIDHYGHSALSERLDRPSVVQQSQ